MADDLDRIIWRGFWGAKGEPPNDQDKNYWRNKWPELEARGRERNEPDYAWQRLIGRGAGAADLPTYGPYASPPSELHDVPPFPGDEPQQPPAPPQPPAEPSPDLGDIARSLEELPELLASIDVRLSDQNEQLRSIADSLRQIAAKY